MIKFSSVSLSMYVFTNDLDWSPCDLYSESIIYIVKIAVNTFLSSQWVYSTQHTYGYSN